MIITMLSLIVLLSCSKKVHNPEDDWLPLDGMPERTRPDTTKDIDINSIYPKSISSNSIHWWLLKLQLDYNSMVDDMYNADLNEYNGEIIEKMSQLIFTIKLMRNGIISHHIKSNKIMKDSTYE